MKKKKLKIRIPTAKGSIAFRSDKDYNRRKLKKAMKQLMKLERKMK